MLIEFIKWLFLGEGEEKQNLLGKQSPRSKTESLSLGSYVQTDEKVSLPDGKTATIRTTSQIPVERSAEDIAKWGTAENPIYPGLPHEQRNPSKKESSPGAKRTRASGQPRDPQAEALRMRLIEETRTRSAELRKKLEPGIKAAAAESSKRQRQKPNAGITDAQAVANRAKYDRFKPVALRDHLSADLNAAASASEPLTAKAPQPATTSRTRAIMGGRNEKPLPANWYNVERTPEEIELERQLWEGNDAPGPVSAKPKPESPKEMGKTRGPRKARQKKGSGWDVHLPDLLENCIVYDLETTGGSRHADYIIQVAAAKVRGGRVVDRFSSFVKPPIGIPSFITGLTGISDVHVRSAPRAVHVLSEFSRWAGADILVAHNGASFDRHFLQTELSRAGAAIRETRGFDSLLLARRLGASRSNGLDALGDHYGILAKGRRHEASSDVQMLFDVLCRLVPDATEAGHAVLPGHPVSLLGDR